MTQPRKSVLVKSIDLQASLAILQLLELELQKEDSYGHHVEAGLYDGPLTLTQGSLSKNSAGTERVASITFPNQHTGDIVIEFGLATSFETMEDLDTDPREMTLYDAVRLCRSDVDSIEVKSVTFRHDDFISASTFLYKWLFPESTASA